MRILTFLKDMEQHLLGGGAGGGGGSYVLNYSGRGLAQVGDKAQRWGYVFYKYSCIIFVKCLLKLKCSFVVILSSFVAFF